MTVLAPPVESARKSQLLCHYIVQRCGTNRSGGASDMVASRFMRLFFICIGFYRYTARSQPPLLSSL